MDYQNLIIQIIVGGLLGVLGQGIRMIVGLKKWYDDQKSNPGTAENFSVRRILLSVFIGFISGGLGILTFGKDFDLTLKQNIITMLGIGYAGVDFIEGFITKYLPETNGDLVVPAKVNSTPIAANPVPDAETNVPPVVTPSASKTDNTQNANG